MLEEVVGAKNVAHHLGPKPHCGASERSSEGRVFVMFMALSIVDKSRTKRGVSRHNRIVNRRFGMRLQEEKLSPIFYCSYNDYNDGLARSRLSRGRNQSKISESMTRTRYLI